MSDYGVRSLVEEKEAEKEENTYEPRRKDNAR
jgi:hypothetical protein